MSKPGSRKPTEPRRVERRFWLGLAAASLAAGVYLNALHNPFVYDDYSTVVANPSLVDPGNIRFVLVHSPFRPVVNISYAIDRVIWGFDPFGYHLTNLVLHALVVMLVFVLVRTAIADARGGRRETDAWVAFGAAVLFAVHPLMTQAVAYVSGRSELLSGLWFVSGLLLARRAILTGGMLPVAGALVCGVLAVLSKETGAMLPVVVFAYDRLLLHDTPDARRRRAVSVFLPIFAIMLAGGAFRLLATDLAAFDRTPLQNLLTQAIVIWRYVGLFVWPAGQAIMHAVYEVRSTADPRALLAVAGLLLAAVAACRVRRVAPLAALGVVWYLAVIAPSSSIVALREAMSEHRAYLASVGVVLVLAGAVAWHLGRPGADGLRARTAYALLLVVAVGILAPLTLARNRIWGDPVALWQEAALRAPGLWEPRYALGDTLRTTGDCAAAIEAYEAVVELRPAHRDAYTNLGICLAEVGRFDDAEGAFRRSLAIDPGYARGYTNLGVLATRTGEPEQARDYYLEALVREPQNVFARMQLAMLYERIFYDYHAAARMCGEARAIAPATPGVAECVERNQRLAAAQDAGE